MEESYFVFLEQIQDTVIVLFNDGVLARQHFADV